MTQNQDDCVAVVSAQPRRGDLPRCLKLTSPIATEEVFGVHAAAIDRYLTELVYDIHLAGDSTGEDAIYHAQTLINTCHDLMGYLLAHSDNLMSQEKHNPKPN